MIRLFFYCVFYVFHLLFMLKNISLNKSHADVKVFVEKYESQADLVVYKVNIQV